MRRRNSVTSIVLLSVAAAVLIALTVLQPSGGGAQAAGGTPTPPPTYTPVTISAGLVTAHSIALSWSSTTLPKVTAYHVILANRATPALYSEIDLQPGAAGFSSRSATFTGEPEGTTYVAQVFTCDGNGICYPSDQLLVRTLAASGGSGCTLHGPPPICQ
jgi:hypothetical protein